MIDSIPTVQVCRGIRRIMNARDYPEMKRLAHRERRHAVRQMTAAIARDPELFDNETFAAATVSSWDVG
jgi:hypothetical protein